MTSYEWTNIGMVIALVAIIIGAIFGSGIVSPICVTFLFVIVIGLIANFLGFKG